MAKTIEEALEQLKRDPTQPVRTNVGGLTIEVRAIPAQTADRSAADIFADLGPWAGESTEQMLELLAAARRRGGQRSIREL
jgi:hypothetical protein